MTVVLSLSVRTYTALATSSARTLLCTHHMVKSAAGSSQRRASDGGTGQACTRLDEICGLNHELMLRGHPMDKNLRVGLVVVVAFGVLVACGGDEEELPEVECTGTIPAYDDVAA